MQEEATKAREYIRLHVRTDEIIRKFRVLPSVVEIVALLGSYAA